MAAPLSGFEPLEEPNIKIWRYMDFTKFVDMLEHGGLFFPRVDKLSDPFEGSWRIPFPPSNAELGPLTLGGITFPPFLGRDAYEGFREYVIVNCWHMNEYESDAMWSRYGGTNGSVVIQSTYSLLRASLPPVFHLGTVRYIVFEKQVPQDVHSMSDDEFREKVDSLMSTMNNAKSPQEIPELLFGIFGQKIGVPSSQKLMEMLISIFLQKRKAFQHEQELRAVVFLLDVLPDVSVYFDTKQGDTIPHPTVPGVWCPLDLSKLIEHVYIAPNARGSFKDLVEKVMTRYELDIPVNSTTMDDYPNF